MKASREIPSGKGQNPDANRRWFLRTISALAGGAALGSETLARQADRKSGQRPRKEAGARKKSFEKEASSGQKFQEAMQAIKNSGNFKASNSSWQGPLKGFSSIDRLAVVMAIDLSQKYPSCEDIVGKMAAVMGSMLNDPGYKRALDDIQQSSGGKGGFFCGRGCGETAGSFCGNGCPSPGLFPIDVAAAVLQSGEFNAQNVVNNFGQLTQAMKNAAQAYKEIFLS